MYSGLAQARPELESVINLLCPQTMVAIMNIATCTVMCKPCSDAVDIHASLAINHFDEDAILWCKSDAYNSLQGNLKKDDVY